MLHHERSQVPDEHLARMQAALLCRRAKSVFASYAAVYRDLAAAPRRPVRATYLVVGAGSEAELRRIAELVRRVAEECGVELRELPASELSALWSSAARAGSEHRLGVHTATGDGLLAALHFGHRSPSQVPPGSLTASSRRREVIPRRRARQQLRRTRRSP